MSANWFQCRCGLSHCGSPKDVRDASQCRGGGLKTQEQCEVAGTGPILYPSGNPMPRLGARDPALLAAFAPENGKPLTKLLAVFVIVPEIFIERNIPLCD